jgi:aminobenzoyl-glutamate utilization protein B
MVKNLEVADWLEERQERFITMSDTIWENPEVALAETKACALQAEFLEAEGFTVTRNVGDLPTAFSAEWGSGSPTIGFLGEYDALPNLSQKRQAGQDPEVVGGPGHGCGHNLLGTAALASAVALKAWLEQSDKPGTVRYYGCPAEETGAGKVFMARAGAFDGLDAALTWHPWSYNTVWQGSSLAVDHIKFRFFGKTAHAAAVPHLGRSALDAVELLNISANFMREHVIDSARIHYVVTNGGGQPNVVPDEAEVWYYVRAPERYQVEEITNRIRNAAKGATLMTDTRVEEHDVFGVHNYLANQPITDVAWEVLNALGPIEFTEEEEQFAQEVVEGFPADTIRSSKRPLKIPEEDKQKALLGGIYDPNDPDTVLPGSTDVSDVSWLAPTAQIMTSCWALGVPGHSWGITATGGMSIGHKGMLQAAKVMAITAAELVDNPDILERAKVDYKERLGGQVYRAAIPEGASPPQPYIQGGAK